MYTDDPVRDAMYRDRETQAWLDSRPKCAVCGEPIQDSHAYFIEDQWVCDECIYEYRKAVPDNG
jgi:formylmethanofuran dehydrogenase subunit E